MSILTRRNFLGSVAAAGGLAAIQKAVMAANPAGTQPGPNNPELQAQNPDSMWPPETDSKSLVQNFNFGPKNVGPIYGLMLTAWSFASVFGPLYIARMREMTGNYAGALHVIAGVMALSILLPIIVHPPRPEAWADKPGTIGLTPNPAIPKD